MTVVTHRQTGVTRNTDEIIRPLLNVLRSTDQAKADRLSAYYENFKDYSAATDVVLKELGVSEFLRAKQEN